VSGSTSTDHDDAFADVSHYHYFVEDTAKLSAIPVEERGLTQTVVADVRLVIADAGARIGGHGYPMMRQNQVIADRGSPRRRDSQGRAPLDGRDHRARLARGRALRPALASHQRWWPRHGAGEPRDDDRE
jgi:hypothetical protein